MLALSVGLAGGMGVGTARGATLPQGGVVVAGQAAIAQPSANALKVTTTSARTAIDWTSFSIGNGASVAIAQPGASSITVNQVTGASPSQVFGDLTSNGRVVLTNPNGIWFGPEAHVDVAALVASTATASNAALKAFAAGGSLVLDQPGAATASIVNDGAITVASAGLAAFVAPGVANNGTIQADLGTVQLSSGTTATVDFYGDGLVNFAVGGTIAAAPIGPDGQPLGAAVANGGTIVAHAGTVRLTAGSVAGVIDRAINMSGVVRAGSVTQQGGDIVLAGGDGTTSVSGTLDASSRSQAGGTVEVTGATTVLTGTARLRANGTSGGTVEIGGGPHGGGSLAHALATSIASGALVSATGSAGAGGTVAVWSDGATQVAAEIDAAGTSAGGSVETSGATLDFDGIVVDAGKGGTWLLDPADLTINGGDGGEAATIGKALAGGSNVTIETAEAGDSELEDNPTEGNTPEDDLASSGASTTGPGDITVTASINWGEGGTLTLSAYHSVIIDAGVTINQKVANGGGNIVLIADNTKIDNGGGVTNQGSITTSGTGATIQISSDAAAYNNSGSISAATPSNLSVTEWVGSTADLAAVANNPGGTYQQIANIDLSADSSFTPIGSGESSFTGSYNGEGFTISGLTLAGSNLAQAGLFGDIGSAGSVRNLTLSNLAVSDTSSEGNAAIGGLAGENDGTISGVTVSGTVSGVNGSPLYVGGLVGENTGLVTQSGSTATVSASGSAASVGGLVGHNTGTIDQAYATGAISASGQGTAAGGLVGDSAGGLISEVYATGAVGGGSAAGDNGGLIGDLAKGAIDQAFATGAVSGNGMDGGLAGVIASAATVTNASWATDTTGQPELAGQTLGSANATGKTLSQLQGALPSGFSTSVWSSASGVLPYLTNVTGSQTASTIAGSYDTIAGDFYLSPSTETAESGDTIDLVIGGVSHGATISLASGAYSLLVPPSFLSASGTPILVYVSGSALTGATFYDLATGSLSGLNLYTNTLTLESGTKALSALTADMKTAIGTTTNSAYLFSVSDTVLTPSSGVNLNILATGSGETVTLDQGLSLGSGSLTVAGLSNAVSAPTTVLSSGSYNAGSIDLAGAVTLGAATTLTAGTVTLGTIAGADDDLTIAAGSTGSVTLGATSSALGALSVTAANTTLDGSLTASSIALGAVTLGANTTLTAGTVTLGTIAGAGDDLTIAAGTGTVTLGATSSALGALGVTAGSTTLDGSLTAASIDLGAVTLGGNTTLSTASDNGAITVGAIDGENHALTMTAGSGSVTLGATSSALGALGVTAGNTTLDGSLTAASISFGSVTLGGNTTLSTVSDNGAITVGAINGENNALTVAAGSGSATLGGTGASSALSGLTITAGAVTLGTLTTTSALAYSQAIALDGKVTAARFSDTDAVTLTGAAALDTTSGGVTLGTVDGDYDFAVDAGANAVTLGTVGGTSALASLDLTGGTLDAATITTKGAIVFDGDVGSSASPLSAIQIASGGDLTVGTNPATGNTYTIWAVDFDYSGSTLNSHVSVGSHSLESAGDVSIISASIDGRIVSSAGTVSITTGTLSGIVTAPIVNIGAVTITGSTITATRSVNVAASQDINTTTIIGPMVSATAGNNIAFTTVVATAGVAVVAAGNGISDSAITAPDPIVTAGPGGIVRTTISGDTAIINSPSFVDTTLAASSVTINGVGLGDNSPALTSIDVASAGSQGAGGDNSARGGGGCGYKHQSAGDRGCHGQPASARNRVQNAPRNVYDSANSAINKILGQ